LLVCAERTKRKFEVSTAMEAKTSVRTAAWVKQQQALKAVANGDTLISGVVRGYPDSELPGSGLVLVRWDLGPFTNQDSAKKLKAAASATDVAGERGAGCLFVRCVGTSQEWASVALVLTASYAMAAFFTPTACLGARS
jgi:hypothetical protein